MHNTFTGYENTFLKAFTSLSLSLWLSQRKSQHRVYFFTNFGPASRKDSSMVRLPRSLELSFDLTAGRRRRRGCEVGSDWLTAPTVVKEVQGRGTNLSQCLQSVHLPTLSASSRVQYPSGSSLQLSPSLRSTAQALLDSAKQHACTARGHRGERNKNCLARPSVFSSPILYISILTHLIPGSTSRDTMTQFVRVSLSEGLLSTRNSFTPNWSAILTWESMTSWGKYPS